MKTTLIKQFLQRHDRLISLALVVIVIIVAMGFYQFIWIKNVLPGNDSYTHLAKANVLRTDGFEPASYQHFLPFTLWANMHSDNTLVFDAVIAPLTALSNVMLAAKLFIIILAGAIVTTFYYVSQKVIRKPYLAAALTLVITITNIAFFLKLTELRSLVFSILFYFLTLAFVYVAPKRGYILFFIAILFTLLHTTTMLMFLPIALMFLFDRHNRLLHLKNAGFTIAGMLIGIIIFPSPNFWQTFILQPIVPFIYAFAPFPIEGAFEVKGDIHAPTYLLVSNFTNLIIIFSGLIVYFRALRVRKLRIFSAAQIASAAGLLLIFLLDLFSRRFSDYMAPSALMFVLLHFEQLGALYKQAWKLIMKNRIWKYFITVGAIVVLVAGGWLFYSRFLKDNFSQTDYQGQKTSTMPDPYGAAIYLRGHLPEGSYIYNSAWEEFPFFVYYAPSFKYAAGMELGFLYLYDKDMLRFYQDFRAFRNFDRQGDDLIYTPLHESFRKILTTRFNTSVLAVKKGTNEDLSLYLKDNAAGLNLKKMFEDNYYVIYSL